MTAEAKAKELFNKYCYAIRTEETNSGYFTNVIYAKQCALIAVDEILEIMINNLKWDINHNGNIHYWEEVKQELEKL
jgi:hypothetical protein